MAFSASGAGGAPDGSTDAAGSPDLAAGASGVPDAGSPNDAGPGCLTHASDPTLARDARSAGFSGSVEAYDALYDVSCQTLVDCANACTTAGGSASSCTAGSACIDSGTAGTKQCLPPTYWLNTSSALSESGTTANAAEIVLVDIAYQDALVVTDFGLSIPDGAEITGIQFDIERNADAGLAVDGSIQILKNGSAVGVDHSASDTWPMALSRASYGGLSDTWGAAWLAADLDSAGFGISITPKYTGPTAGNERAHIDSLRVNVFYRLGCR